MAGTRWSVTHVEVSVFEPWVEAYLCRATRAGAQVCSCRTSSVGSKRIRREQPRNHSRINKYDALGSENRALDDSRKTIQESKGRLWIERPNKFRWNYESPAKQQIVSDGTRLWIYDEDLKQVTVRAPFG